MRPEDLFHTGIVVDDLAATRRWLTDVAGYGWCDEYAGDQVVETPGGELTVPIRFAYSMTEPRLELIAAVPGTVWAPSGAGVHHLGYWSDDVDGDIATLAAAGVAVEVRARMPDGSSRFAYCRAEGGPRIELVTRALAPVMAAWFATGHLPG
jgi:catechol 2,3-dioxygenase-like lactoylglutathione lyase family enzyme